MFNKCGYDFTIACALRSSIFSGAVKGPLRPAPRGLRALLKVAVSASNQIVLQKSQNALRLIFR